MSCFDDWSPPVSPSIIAAMDVDIIPETCPSQINASPSKLSDTSDILGQIDGQVLDDLPMSSTQYDDLKDGQSSPLHLTQIDIIQDSTEHPLLTPDEILKPVPFCCKKYRERLDNRITSFKRLFTDTESQHGHFSVVTEVFSSQLVMEILPEKLDHLFYTMKQMISKMNSNSIQSDCDFLNYREQIFTVYTFLKDYLLRLPSNLSSDDETTIHRIVSLLHSIVTYVDRLSDMKFDITLNTSPSDFHRFHLNLDVYWNTLEILYVINKKYTDLFPLKKISSSYQSHESESRPLLSQMLQVVVWELVTTAIFKFQKKTNQDLVHSSPFECCCVKDLWVLLACLLKEKGESLWVSIHEVVQILLDTEVKVPSDIEIDSDVYMYPPVDNIKSSDNSKFCMWMLTNLALLVNTGEEKVVIPSNYYDVNAAVKKILAKGDVNEVDLRFYLWCCHQTSTVWEPNINLLVLFWDYFYKRMNDSFQLRTVSVHSLQTISKTPLDLLERCKQFSTGKTSLKHNETSFHLYLGLLGSHLRQLVDTSSMQEWKQMKGRIYSKFHQRRIQELTETGLNNFTCLFLCLALTADLEDVSTKLCGFYDMVELSKQNIGKCITAWRGMFTLMLLYIEREINVLFIANKLSTAFNNICIEFEMFESDPGYRHELWKLINVYLDGTQEVFDASTNFTLSQQVLLGEGYGKLLKTCRNNEVPSVLTGLHEIISKIRMTCTNEKRSIVDTHLGPLEVVYSSIFDNIYPPVRDLCESQTAQAQLADILAEMSLLAVECRPEDYFTIMKIMIHSENFNKSIVCRYLSHIVTVDHALDLLSDHMTNYQTVLIQTWIRCAMFVPASSQHLQALNRCVIKLPEIQSILSRAGYTISEEPEKIIFHVFKSIQILYDKLENWKEKLELRDQVTEYSIDIHRHILPYLQTFRPVETLSTAYSVVGYLVKCCAHLLYVKSKPNCPLPDIINTMIVPHFVFKKDKPINPVFLVLMRDHLHLFVSGVANLDYKRDPYIQRRLTDIFMVYLVKFWNTGSSTTSIVHPLVMSLKGSYVKQPSESAVCFRQHVLELVTESFMTTTATLHLPENYQMALYFVREVINRTANKSVLAGDLSTLICPVLTIHLQCESVSTQQLCQVLLQQLVDAGTSHQQVAERDMIGREIMAFINRFKKTKLNQAIKTLEKLPITGASYIQKILPQIEHAIVEYESFRGTGLDTRLRQTYHSLIQTFHNT